MRSLFEVDSEVNNVIARGILRKDRLLRSRVLFRSSQVPHVLMSDPESDKIWQKKSWQKMSLANKFKQKKLLANSVLAKRKLANSVLAKKSLANCDLANKILAKNVTGK